MTPADFSDRKNFGYYSNPGTNFQNALQSDEIRDLLTYFTGEIGYEH